MAEFLRQKPEFNPPIFRRKFNVLERKLSNPLSKAQNINISIFEHFFADPQTSDVPQDEDTPERAKEPDAPPYT